MTLDPAFTDPEHYRVILDNDRVRVLEYLDTPGDSTHLHHHPDSVLVPLTNFRRRIHTGDREVVVALEPHAVRWLDAQEHRGTNIGTTASHALFIELKEPRPATGDCVDVPNSLGPAPKS